jgi:hypothetical protein
MLQRNLWRRLEQLFKRLPLGHTDDIIDDAVDNCDRGRFIKDPTMGVDKDGKRKPRLQPAMIGLVFCTRADCIAMINQMRGDGHFPGKTRVTVISGLAGSSDPTEHYSTEFAGVWGGTVLKKRPRSQDGELQDGELQDGELQDGELQDGELQDGELQGLDSSVVREAEAPWPPPPPPPPVSPNKHARLEDTHQGGADGLGWFSPNDRGGEWTHTDTNGVENIDPNQPKLRDFMLPVPVFPSALAPLVFPSALATLVLPSALATLVLPSALATLVLPSVPIPVKSSTSGNIKREDFDERELKGLDGEGLLIFSQYPGTTDRLSLTKLMQALHDANKTDRLSGILTVGAWNKGKGGGATGERALKAFLKEAEAPQTPEGWFDGRVYRKVGGIKLEITAGYLCGEWD